jgi:hypothetical protein
MTGTLVAPRLRYPPHRLRLSNSLTERRLKVTAGGGAAPSGPER